MIAPKMVGDRWQVKAWQQEQEQKLAEMKVPLWAEASC